MCLYNVCVCVACVLVCGGVCFQWEEENKGVYWWTNRKIYTYGSHNSIYVIIEKKKKKGYGVALWSPLANCGWAEVVEIESWVGADVTGYLGEKLVATSISLMNLIYKSMYLN